MLNSSQAGRDRRREIGLREQQAERAVRLVDVAERGDTAIRFVDALAVGEPRRAVVAGACVDLAEAMPHRSSLGVAMEAMVSRLLAAAPTNLAGRRCAYDDLVKIARHLGVTLVQRNTAGHELGFVLRQQWPRVRR